MMKPKFILSKKVALQQYNKAKQVADIVSYSSKTNPLVTPILEENSDAMFSIHFINELKHVQDKSRVLFLAQAWNEDIIGDLVKQGIRWFAVDNETDLDILLNYLEKNDTQINLLLRLKLKENTLRTEKYFVFGMTSEIINRRIRQLQTNDKIEKLGVHFHRKTQNMSEWNYQYEMPNILAPDVLQMIDVMNIGGGLPSEYANTNVDVVNSIMTKITELKSWLNEQNIQLIIEPGRFICASAVRLQTQIVGMHGNTVIVNASVYNSDMDALVVPVKLLIEGELPKGESEPYVVKGSTPCSMDLFRYRVYLENPQVGDTLVFLNAGAYNFTTDFCDLDVIETEVE
jgi:ornithine decarboxylase